MRLSEAIRLGSMASEKCVGEVENHTGARCALGAALYAVGVKPDRARWFWQIENIWPWTTTLVASPDPSDFDTNGIEGLVREHIWRLNDSRGWTRERIADWVATIEPAEPEALVTEPTCEIPTVVL